MGRRFRGYNDERFEVGKFGYLLLLLESIGFSGAAAMPLLIVSRGAYCEFCGRQHVDMKVRFLDVSQELQAKNIAAVYVDTEVPVVGEVG